MADVQKVPNDLLLMITEQVSGLQTLRNLVEAHPSLLSPFVERYFDNFVRTAGEDTWSQELYHYAYVILLAEEKTPDSISEIKTLMDNLVNGSPATGFTGSLPRTPSTLQRLATVVEAVEFFVHFSPVMYLDNFGPDLNKPLSSGEAFRLRRALLRFQLYTQLFHQPEATDEIVSDRDWESRPKIEQYFWTRFETVEVEECKCIYAMLVSLLTQLRPIRSTTNTIDSNSPKAEASTQRGLPLLHKILSGGDVSPLASSYAARLVDYAFTGLDKVDPHDANFFLPYRDFQNPDDPFPRRYKASEAFRESNFGLTMHTRPPKWRKVRRWNDRIPWRLIGYCFWDDERVEALKERFEEMNSWTDMT